MVRLLCLIALIAGSITFQSCAVDNEDTFKTSGAIAYRSDVFTDFQDFYYIVGDDGSEYYPTNLPDEFRHKGMCIRFEAREMPNTRLIEGWGNGPVIELVHIEKIPS
jgi:hypothetical protein